ncbi:hypothetical protein CDD83_7527 [Cordyceps sp. RAO-2017]|nr:hypothetical protein CDD83_7527 [Cordyceps sp. RAO-2017]
MPPPRRCGMPDAMRITKKVFSRALSLSLSPRLLLRATDGVRPSKDRASPSPDNLERQGVGSAQAAPICTPTPGRQTNPWSAMMRRGLEMEPPGNSCARSRQSDDGRARVSSEAWATEHRRATETGNDRGSGCNAGTFVPWSRLAAAGRARVGVRLQELCGCRRLCLRAGMHEDPWQKNEKNTAGYDAPPAANPRPSHPLSLSLSRPTPLASSDERNGRWRPRDRLLRRRGRTGGPGHRTRAVPGQDAACADEDRRRAGVATSPNPLGRK